MIMMTRLCCSGLKATLSSALGMTDTCSGLTEPRSTVFSMSVWDTLMEWLVLARDNLRTVFAMLKPEINLFEAFKNVESRQRNCFLGKL